MAFRDSALLVLDAAWRLGPRPVAQMAWHRSPAGRWRAQRALAKPARLSDAPVFAAALSAAPHLPSAESQRLLRAAAAIPTVADWHGSLPAAAPASGLNLFGAGDVRAVWERNRWAELPLLAQAHRLAPAAGWRDRAEALLTDWLARNPAYRGPNWACGQEAALRLLHLALALTLLDRNSPGPAARALLAAHVRRIVAAPAMAWAQDNNHPVSEAAGLFVAGLLLRDAALLRSGGRDLRRSVGRLVAPCGAFAPASTGYHRLLLDVLSVTEWLRRRLDGPAADELVVARAGVATRWLHRLVAQGSGALPRLGHQDGSCVADLAVAGPNDARPSIERAARLFLDRSAGFADDPGCAWLDLPTPAVRLPVPAAEWRSAGFLGWSAAGARGVLRTGPLRFRPGHADLLHFDLFDGDENLLRDGGTGAYNPPPETAWWLAHLPGTAAHNTIAFDGGDQMVRLSRFLFARWPRCGALADGGWLRDHRGNRHTRRVTVAGRAWRVEDEVAGPFRALALRWRLAPDRWRLTRDGVLGPRLSIVFEADAPFDCVLEQGWESPAYGRVVPAPVLVLRARAPLSRIVTSIDLPAVPEPGWTCMSKPAGMPEGQRPSFLLAQKCP